MRFRLSKVSQTLFLIKQGQKTVGRVVMHGAAFWVGIIGATQARGRSAEEAFGEAFAQHCGFENEQELREHNSRTQRANAQKRRELRGIIDDMTGGELSALERLLRKGQP